MSWYSLSFVLVLRNLLPVFYNELVDLKLEITSFENVNFNFGV